MYVFWFIPIALAVIALIWGLYSVIKRQPVSQDHSRVLTDKPKEEPPPA